MSDYCVILRGRLPGDCDDAEVWAPIARSLRLDQAAFAVRVLAALPLIVRRQLDEDAAGTLVGSLAQIGADACAMPDEAQLAYLERDGSTRGPLPLRALPRFIQPGERYRLRDTQDWKIWSSIPAAEIDPAQAGREPLVAGAAAAPPMRAHDSTAAVPPTPGGDAVAATGAGDAGEAADTAATPSINPAPPASAPAVAPASPAWPPTDVSHRTDTPSAEAIVESAAPATPSLGRRLLLPVGRTRLSIAAGYLGLLAIIPYIAPLTLVVSILAWRDLRRRPDKYGRGRTMFGLIMGVGMSVLLVVGVAVELISPDPVDSPVPASTTAVASGSVIAPTTA